MHKAFCAARGATGFRCGLRAPKSGGEEGNAPIRLDSAAQKKRPPASKGYT